MVAKAGVAEAVVAKSGVAESVVAKSGVAKAGIAKGVVAKGVVGEAGVRKAGVGQEASNSRSSNKRSSSQRSGSRQHVDGSRGLLGSKTTSSGVIESSLESSLGSSNILDVIQVGAGDLSCLHVAVDGVGSVRTEGSVLTSLSSSKGSGELSLGGDNLGGVLEGRAGGEGQERAGDLWRDNMSLL